MPESKYKVLLELRPAAQLEASGADQFAVDTTQFRLKEIRHPSFPDVPVGVEMLGELAANSIEDAWHTVAGQAEGIASIISFLTRSGMPSVEVLCAWESTPGKKEGPFLQLYKMPVEQVPTRNLQKVGFDKIAEKLETAAQKDSIARAIGWYRKGLNTADVVDRFTHFWFGLENLNGPFITRLQVVPERAKCQCGQDHAPCSHCGAVSYRQDPRGVKAFVSKRPDLGAPTYERMLRFRHDIVHGEKSLAHLRQEAASLAASAEEILSRGVRWLLELGTDTSVPDRPVTNAIPFRARFDGIISGPDLAMVDEFSTPHFIIGEDQVGFHRNDENQLMVGIKQNLRLSIHPCFRLELVGVGIYGEGGNQSKITVEKKPSRNW